MLFGVVIVSSGCLHRTGDGVSGGSDRGKVRVSERWEGVRVCELG